MKKLTFFAAFIFFSTLSISCSEKNTKFEPQISEEVIEALKVSILDEYRAQVVYQKILNDFGLDTKPFVNIKKAEVKHADAIANLMVKYNVDVPQNPFDLADVPLFESVKDACAQGVQAEIENIEIYDQFLSLELPDDVRMVLESNRAASLNNHLPAFENCNN